MSEASFLAIGGQDVLALRGSVRLYLPGWATDYRIFGDSAFAKNRDAKGDGLLLIKAEPVLDGEPVNLYLRYSDPAALPWISEMIAASSAEWSLVGLSLGGFMAHELAVALPSNVTSLTMIGIRRQYSSAVCRAMQRQLRQDKDTLLAGFWEGAFGVHGRVYPLDGACDEGVLSRGLAYLGAYRWALDRLACPVLCMHGECDAIAPLAEAADLAAVQQWAFHVLSNEAHIPRSGWENCLSHD
jgi:pimeloyl-ACP methyl ester carboxylesterase